MTFVANTPQLGVVDLTDIDTAAPGASGRWPFLGSIVSGYDNANPNPTGGEFIYLAVPTSTAIPLGTIVSWDANYRVGAYATTGAQGISAAVAIRAIASSTSLQYAWFQIQGKATVLKAAVTMAPNSKVFISGTAGRITNVSSTGKTFLGMRSANTATVTSTTSTVVVFINRPALMGT